MNKYYIVLCFLIASITGNAQIILDNSWFYQPGQQIYFVRASNSEEITKPISGANVTWDFSNATELRRDTIFLVEPAGLPDSELFPEATVAELHSTLPQVSYYESKTDSLKLLGIWGNANVTIDYIKPFLIKIAPFNYGDTIFHESQFVQIFNTAPQAPRQESTELTYSGWGTVMTPSGQIDNCIMVEKYNYDDQGFLGIYGVTFFKDNLANRVATYSEIDLQGSQVISFEWGEGFILSNTEESIDFNLGVTVTNDLSSNICLNSTKEMDVSMLFYDMKGQLISKSKAHIQKGGNDFSHLQLPTGQYFLQLIDHDTKNFKTFKLSRFK